jgi:hypothetical protein
MQARFSVTSQRGRTASLSCAEKRTFSSRAGACLGARVFVAGDGQGNVAAPMLE